MTSYSAIAHRDLANMNPLSSSTLDDVVGQLALSPGARVLDLGCGKGELLRRIVAAHACEVEGIDASEALISVARRAVPTGRFRVADASAVTIPPGHYHLAACVGASHALGTMNEALAALSRAARPDGMVLFGEAFFRAAPDDAYLAATGMRRDALSSLEDTISAAWSCGLTLRDTFVASGADFARYEAAHARAIAAYARDNPSDPEAAAMLTRSRDWHQAFERWGRRTLGFALFLLAKRP